MKPKTCQACGAKFQPQRMGQKACSPLCAIAVGRAKSARDAEKQEAARKRETRARLESLKTVPELMAEADKAFCAYIRKRDEHLPCICCGRTSSGWTRGGEWDAGHFRSRGAASHLRYNEDNCQKQLKHCNRRAWDVASYERNLVARIGQERVDALKADNTPRKWSRDELREIKGRYQKKLKNLQKTLYIA